MYKCNVCNSAFEQYDAITDINRERWHICPYCRSENFGEAKRCELCGEYYTESTVSGVCERCITEIEERFSVMLNGNFSKFEISVLNTVYDGRNLE